MEKYLKTLRVLHLALVAGLIFGYYFIGNINNLSQLKFPTVNSNNVIYALIPIIAFIASHFIFKQLLSKIDTKQNINQLIIPYQSASIVRWAIIEGSAFVILILNSEFILFGILLIIYLILLLPTEHRMKKDLNLYD